MTTTQTPLNLIEQIAGISVHQLADRFGTPVYVYDEEKILQRIDDLRQFDLIRYAQKANSNLALLDLMRRRGVVADAVSAGEIHRALAAGYQPAGDPPPLVYTADIFDTDALEAVCEHQIHCNLGSPDMIRQLGQRRGGGEMTLRINPGFGHGHHHKTNTGGPHSKHGIWHDQLAHCIELADQYQMTVSGLHMHIGSGTDLEHLAQVCQAMERMAQQVGPSITSISAGGGLPIVYRDGESQIDLQRYFQCWDAVRQNLQNQWQHPVRLEIEPGRYVTAEAGYLIARICAVKQVADKTFYLVDAGFNNLARPVLYGAYHPMAIAPSRQRELPASEHEVVVGGPLCESGDIFTQDEGGVVCTRLLPHAEVGDLLVIQCAGAYGFTMSSNYNSKPMAAEVLIRDGEAHLVRRRQKLEDLVRDEVIPPSEPTTNG